MHAELIEEIKHHVEQIADIERGFGPSIALMKYGSAFQPLDQRPQWLRQGQARDCFNNATAYAAVRDDVLYAEGYALEPELPLPVQHAWLVDRHGQVIDPTWKDTRDHAYFGIAFKRDFVRDQLGKNRGNAGILVNLHLLRRQYRTPLELEAVISDASAALPAP
ncbi:hypothetical protein [Ensifer sp. ENS12]|uniref:hypothetical protein n=1 Tax=Ensifer sp. ENS12 TaxID=2854774 RepID=UPI001C4582B3|nr:hypothetical protein [Ensifer sp. ENS12]MBV7518960.1 hypothetical protein [Ensifer sp. ENS12]